MTTATPPTGTRAVLLKWAPTVHRCDGCDGWIIGHKGRRPAICCNVHEDGHWARVVYFHVSCYQGQYGPVIDRGLLPAHARTTWTYA